MTIKRLGLLAATILVVVLAAGCTASGSVTPSADDLATSSTSSATSTDPAPTYSSSTTSTSPSDTSTETPSSSTPSPSSSSSATRGADQGMAASYCVKHGSSWDTYVAATRTSDVAFYAHTTSSGRVWIQTPRWQHSTRIPADSTDPLAANILIQGRGPGYASPRSYFAAVPGDDGGNETDYLAVWQAYIGGWYLAVGVSPDCS